MHISDVDLLVESFSNDVIHFLDLHAPLRPCISKRELNPWFNAGVSRAIVDRDMAY